MAKNFLREEMKKLRNARYAGGITFEEFEEISEIEDKEIYLN